jgi:hypothetical protein
VTSLFRGLPEDEQFIMSAETTMAADPARTPSSKPQSNAATQEIKVCKYFFTVHNYHHFSFCAIL